MAQTSRSDLPWFFPAGVISTQDPVDQMIEYEKYLLATDFCMQGRGFAVIQDPRSVRVKTNIKSTSSITNPNTNMEIVLDNYIEINNEVRVSTFCEQRFITQDQKEVVVQFMIKFVNEAADIQFNAHKNLKEGAIKSLAQQNDVSVSELKKRLNEKDSLSGLYFWEIYGIPKDMQRSDFVPRELHLGYMPEFHGVLGAAWLNTGLVYYNPQSAIIDYLKGKPVILAHEFMHTNSNLQKFPFADGFDAEFFASYPMLLPEARVSFFFHGYLAEAREAAWVFFGFDFNQARKEIIKLNLGGNIIIDEKKYREYFEKQEVIKKEFAERFPQALEMYYSNPLWWSAFHEKLKDQVGVFKMLMAQNYDFTLLGGREKTMTRYYLKKETINEVAKEAWTELEDNSSGNPSEGVRIPDSMLNFYNQSFNTTEKENIKNYFIKNPKAITETRKLGLEEAFKLLKTIGRGGVQ